MSSSCIPPPDAASFLLAGVAVSSDAAHFLSSPALRASPTRRKARRVCALQPWQQVQKKKKKKKSAADGRWSAGACGPAPSAWRSVLDPSDVAVGRFSTCFSSLVSPPAPGSLLLCLFLLFLFFLMSVSPWLALPPPRSLQLTPWLALCQTLAKVPAPLVTLSRWVAAGHRRARRWLVYPSLLCGGLTGFSSPGPPCPVHLTGCFHFHSRVL